MNVFSEIAKLSSLPGPLHLAIGVFDGVHLGHQEVIGAALKGARASGGSAVVVTFDPHPVRVLAPEKAPRLIAATQHKILILKRMGIRHLLTIPFTPEFAKTPPEVFVHQLADAAKPLRQICVGYEWTFGHQRAGNLELLAKVGRERGFDVHGVSPVQIDGETVSSTIIRQAVRSGDLAKAAQLLGREYTVLGTVIEGKKLGQTIGFPTANLSVHNEQLPPNGVYAVDALLERPHEPEIRLTGVGNLGFRPTVENQAPERALEVHLFEWHEDIYGADLEVRFVKFLREEQKFPSIEALTKQIGKDAEEARRCLNLPPG